MARELEEALTSVWHGASAGLPAYRWELVPALDAATDTIVVAFSSLGDYLIRPEFRKTLGDLACARLFVMDPSCSWVNSHPDPEPDPVPKPDLNTSI